MALSRLQQEQHTQDPNGILDGKAREQQEKRFSKQKTLKKTWLESYRRMGMHLKEKKFRKNFQQAGTPNSSLICIYLFTLIRMENI